MSLLRKRCRGLAPPPTRSVAGRGRGWGALGHSFIQRCLDGGQHAVDVAEHIIVPESQHAIAARIEELGSRRVGDHLIIVPMLAAVDLDNEPQIMARKVYIVRPNCCLTTKMRSLRSNATQMPPELSLSNSHVATKLACARNARVRFARSALWCQCPRPPPPTPPRRFAGGGERRRPASLTTSKRQTGIGTLARHLADRLHGVVRPLAVLVPELRETCRVEVARFEADLDDRVRELR